MLAWTWWQGDAWRDIAHLQVSVGEKVVRTLLIYVLLVAALRLVGKRELGQANTLDLVVLLLVANAVQNGIIGDDLSVTGAVVGAVVLFGVNELFNRASYVFPLASRVLEGSPTVLITHGRPVSGALRRTGISLSELNAIARRQGFTDLDSVHTATRDQRRGPPCARSVTDVIVEASHAPGLAQLVPAELPKSLSS